MTASSDLYYEDVNDSDAILFTVSELFSAESSVNKNNKSEEKFEVKLQVEKQIVKFLIDSGAAVNILNIETFEMLNRKCEGKLILRKNNTKIVTYGAEKPTLQVLGVANLLIESKDK